MNFIEQFSGAWASFIWSTNVVLDNEVLLRYEAKIALTSSPKPAI
ncbi:hypothetical protein VCHENC03_4000 [Vibrio sp. HENC-03]|nr:hypothetical protein VCHENC03_4000 [Vibrio sp. HENC-03]